MDCSVQVRGLAEDYRLENQKALKDYKKFISQSGRFLRVMPHGSYYVIHNPNADSSLTGWTAGGDGVSLAKDPDEFWLDDGSYSLTADVSVATGNISLSTTTNTAQNHSTILDSNNNTEYLPCWELAFFNPFITRVDSVDVRVGSSDTAYYKFESLNENYEGLPFEYGWNYISIPHGDMTPVGSPSNSAIGSYIYLQINHSEASNATDISDFRYGGLLLTRDADVENYLCSLDGDIQTGSDPKKQIAVDVQYTLVNTTGISESTHTEEHFSQTGITSGTDTQVVDFNGNALVLPRIEFTLNDVENLEQLRLTNQNTGQFLEFLSSDWADGDVVILENYDRDEGKFVRKNGVNLEWDKGRLLEFKPGRNEISFNVIQQPSETIEQLVSNATQTDASSVVYAAQEFLTGTAGELQRVELEMDLTGPFGVGGAAVQFVDVFSDSGGTPGSKIGSLVLVGSIPGPWFVFTGSVSLAASTKYYLGRGIEGGYYTSHWKYNTAGGYANGKRWTSTASGGSGSWTSHSGSDFAFKLEIAPVPATNIDWALYAKRRYN